VVRLHQTRTGWLSWQRPPRWPDLSLIASRRQTRLLADSWPQVETSAPGSANRQRRCHRCPPITSSKGEELLELGLGRTLRLIPVPTPRCPAPWWRLRKSSGLLMSGKFFAAHL